MAIQGEDIQVRLTLTSLGVAIQPSTLDAYSVNVYYLDAFGVKQNLATYKNTNTGLYDIVIFSNPLGKIDIIINRELTKTITGNKIYAEVFIRTSASAEFILSKSVNGESAIFICDFYPSANSNAI